MFSLTDQKTIKRSGYVAKNRNKLTTDQHSILRDFSPIEDATELSHPLSVMQRQRIVNSIGELHGNACVQRTLEDYTETKSTCHSCGTKTFENKCAKCQAELSLIDKPNEVKANGNNVLQRDVELDPIIMVVPRSNSRRSRRQADRQQRTKQNISDSTMHRLPSVARTFVNEWFDAVSAATNSISEPESPEAKMFWNFALAGNLAWALTPLIAPELVVGVSVIGAFVGSGGLQQLFQKPIPNAKPYVIKSLAKKADKMNLQIRPFVIDTATSSAVRNVRDEALQDRILWSRMFPKITYEQRYDLLTSKSLQAAESALNDFLLQYQAWEQSIESCTLINPFSSPSPDLVAGNKSNNHSTGVAQAQFLPYIQRQLFPLFFDPNHSDRLKACMNQIPFNPRLNFNFK